MTRADQIARNLAAVRERIARAEAAAGRDAGSVRLLAVSKGMPASDIAAAMAVGQRDFGENYAQELRDKMGELGAGTGAGGEQAPRWHYIGPLQKNKIKYIAGRAALIESIDAADVLDELDRRLLTGGAAVTAQDCLVQVNVAAEARKHGVPPESLPALLDRFRARAHVRCVGLMLVPPLAADPEMSRPHFAALRRLRDEARRQGPHAQVDPRELSMGMSHDLEVAIAEGATLVRVGTAIFGARPAARA